MKEIECPACGEMIPEDSLYCDMCGVQLLECVNCGAVGTDQFCAECGKPMIARKQPKPEPEVIVDPPLEPQEPDDDGGKTVGRRRKKLVLKARKGGLVIEPQDGSVIGRGEGPYTALRSMDLISRRHGQFVKKGRDWYITDFGSTNGTLVNDVELEPDVPMKFAVGDVIDIGTYIFDVIEQ